MPTGVSPFFVTNGSATTVKYNLITADAAGSCGLRGDADLYTDEK